MADTEQFANYQYEIYIGGLGGRRPPFPISISELELRAREVLSAEAYGYVAGGAGSEDTMTANLAAFKRWRIVPRMMRDVGTRDLKVELFGSTLATPILLAPIGVLGQVHEEGELAVARAAAVTGIPFVLSNAASRSMEEVATAAGDGHRWFQLYWPNDQDLAVSFLERAEASGYSAIVATLDTWLLAWRPRDLQAAYLPFLQGQGVGNYFSDPVFRAALDKPPEEDLGSAVMHWASVFSDPTVTWEDLAFLRANTDLPILLKGILHPQDARRAIDAGMDGIIVSNHGGRQVDGAIATLDALPGIANEVGDDVPVLMDSGIRCGADVVKALCLGARAVLVGRPYVWSLAVGGTDGVVQFVRGLLAEFDLTVALSGRASVAELDTSVLVAV